jgi:hypothetical protein
LRVPVGCDADKEPNNVVAEEWILLFAVDDFLHREK